MADDPWTDWYDAYRRQRDGLARADAALKRQVSWMACFIAGWSALVCAATVFVIWLLFW